MLKTELLEIISNGESSGIEFKRDDIRPEELGKEVVALANFQGGRILIGVEDDGKVSGIQRAHLEEWVMNIFREKVHPFINPYYEEVIVDDKRVAIVSIEKGTSKPYVLRHHGQERIYIRVGTISRDATRDQQARLYDAGGMLHAETMPVSGTSLQSLDMERVKNYFCDIIEDPELPSSEEQWVERMAGLGFLARPHGVNTPCTIAGLLSFGIAPRRYLPQAGIRFMAFEGKDKTYRAIIDEVLDGPLFNRLRKTEAGNLETIDDGLMEKLSHLMLPYLSQEGDTIGDGMRRERTWLYPWAAIRETIINAIVHRDWTRLVDIEIVVYSDRIEVTSPGALQNSMTIEKMIAGQRSPRNPLIVSIMRDYKYVDARGMGVRTKVIPLMRQHNQKEPIFVATEDFLKVSLYKA